MPELEKNKTNYMHISYDNIPFGEKVENPVCLLLDNQMPVADADGKYPEIKTEELPEMMLLYLCRNINSYYSTNEDKTQKTVDETLNGTVMGEPAIGEKGTITTSEGAKLHFIAYYALLDVPDLSKETKSPVLWAVITPSDDKDALELMERQAEAPLKEAKLHTY